MKNQKHKRSLQEKIERSFESLHPNLNNLRLVYIIIKDNSVRATRHNFHDAGFVENFEYKDDVFKDNISFNKRQKEELGLDKLECHLKLMNS